MFWLVGVFVVEAPVVDEVVVGIFVVKVLE